MYNTNHRETTRTPIIYQPSAKRKREAAKEKIMDKFILEADSRQTCVEIMEAIAEIAVTYEEAVEIWEAPTQAQVTSIATKLDTPSDYCWGASGSSWNK